MFCLITLDWMLVKKKINQIRFVYNFVCTLIFADLPLKVVREKKNGYDWIEFIFFAIHFLSNVLNSI